VSTAQGGPVTSGGPWDDLVGALKGLGFIRFAIIFATIFDREAKARTRWGFWPARPRPEKYGGGFWSGQLDMLRTMASAVITWMSKARQMGGSEGAALYAIYVCLTEPSSLVMVFSIDMTAAKAFLSERVAPQLAGILGLADEWPFLDEDGLPPWKIYDSGRIVFFEGTERESVIEAHSSNDSGAASRTFRLAIFDEIRYYVYREADELWASIMGAIHEGYSQVIGISTAKGGTWYNDMTKLVMENGVPDAQWVFIPDSTNPSHQAEGWRERKLKSYKNNKAQLSVMNPEVPEDMFVTASGLVINSLNEERHRRRLTMHMDDPEWVASKQWQLWYDDGHTNGHPAHCAFICYDEFTDITYQFDEAFFRPPEKESVDFPVIARGIVEKVVSWMRQGMPVPDCYGDVLGKIGARNIASVMLEETERIVESGEVDGAISLSFSGADKADKEGSVALLQNRFFHDKAFIDPRCTNSWQQLSGWVYDERTGKPSELEDEACFTAETEVLTPTGWKSLAVMEMGDVVGVVNEEGILSFEPNHGVVHKEYNGGVHTVNEHHLEFTATDNHRHAVISQFDWRVKNRYRLQRATVDELRSESYWPQGPTLFPSGEGMFCGLDGGKDPLQAKVTRAERIAWIAGFWLAEGCFDTGRPTFVLVCQKKEQHKKTLRWHLKKLGWTWGETKVAKDPGMVMFCISRQPWFPVFLKENFGNHSYGKFLLPKTIMKMSSRERAAFFEGYMCGDGCRTERVSGEDFDSVSKPLVDGMQVLAHSLGFGCRIVSYKSMAARQQNIRGRICNVRQSYRGHLHHQKPVAHIKLDGFSRRDVHALPVHCITTRTGMFYARTNGKPFVAGNCDVLRYQSTRVKKRLRPPPKGMIQRAIESLQVLGGIEQVEPPPPETPIESMSYGHLESRWMAL